MFLKCKDVLFCTPHYTSIIYFFTILGKHQSKAPNNLLRCRDNYCMKLRHYPTAFFLPENTNALIYLYFLLLRNIKIRQVTKEHTVPHDPAAY